MYAVCVTFVIKDGDMARFLPLMQENATRSLQDEVGCRQFDICSDPARPDEVFLYELYDDRAAFDAHLASAHFLAFDSAVGPMIADKIAKTYEQVRAA